MKTIQSIGGMKYSGAENCNPNPTPAPETRSLAEQRAARTEQHHVRMLLTEKALQQAARLAVLLEITRQNDELASALGWQTPNPANPA